MRLKSPDIFKEKVFIGEGTFGKVYRAKIGDSTYALKKIKLDGIHKSTDTHFGFPTTTIREIKMLKKLAHPNIVQLVDIIKSKS
jgi:serine/threonine protein kinase